MIKAAAPGKLYIAGEYAVVETGYPAILVALNQFVFCTVEKSSDVGSILSTQYSENSIYWRRQDNQMIFDNRDNPFHYILSAIKITEDYACSLGLNLSVYHLKIDSQLDSSDGKKYGLGSSAAVTVATVKALCEFYQLNVTQDIIFKLSAIAHFEVQGNGSLGDIAASVYGGWIAYHSFDRRWLMEQRKKTNLIDLIAMDWPNLEIEQLKAPNNLMLLIGWTGSPASTSKLVDKVSIAKARESQEYQDFLLASQECIQKMILGFRNNNLNVIQDGIRKNRQILHALSKLSGVSIETKALTNLCEIAEEFNGAAKTSGAGGGDCGIVAIDAKSNLSLLIEKWTNAKIERLNLSVHEID
ncbi:phosphomevalonate kinase [Paucilactobacillus oligofermentans DSM 15707 = LMG 22743]|uniref:phosphomevalonate kinase n=1 Tax=Paucilactobacillus oligofermentans DSM 15707 = LMG 22743 TaxID=1423778 RepID=A0A0R1RE66_9LACO|nr:phosphomevalonate kinase [Paucilactobacillus oligofermentans]KRL54881.1 phosphomevalonate kinase [Paucilactobacillus oligofermentans DSM 15707 = LMG 22743]CUS26204.1 Phosphomevalonate kinase [Paucilactobacillus oligofermentans DSM 15707 = LMG 22743]